MAILKDLIVQNAARIIGNVYGNSFVKAGGTASQFLKADGSVDSNAYLTSYTNTIGMVYCETPAGTAAKVGSCTGYSLKSPSYMMVTIRYTNSYSSGALTLNINSTGAKSIYINGTASSSSNYTLPAGIYWVYYYNDIYYFRTDGQLTVNGNVFDGIGGGGGGGTDEKVKQNAITSSDSNSYPLLATGTTAPAGTAQESNYSSTKLNKDGDIIFDKTTKCSLQYDNTNLCLNFAFE